MDSKEKKGSEKMFSFGKFEKMAEMMKNCCPEGVSMANCCSMMKKMMADCAKVNEEKKETVEAGEGKSAI